MASLFGIKKAVYARIRAGYVYDEHDPYMILGVSHSDSDSHIKAARNRLLHEFHPDQLRAKGLPEAFNELYTQKTVLINQAFSQISQHRVTQDVL